MTWRAVGANLNDHYVVRVSHRVRGAETINQLRPRRSRWCARSLKFGDGR